MLRGVGYALVAGLFWGLVFVAPVVLPGYPPAVLSVGRYVAFGLIALVLAIPDRRALRALERADWVEATWLSLIGNLVYYGFLAAAIQVAGGPVPTMIIGTLPVVIAVCSNLSGRELPWRSLAGSLAVIGAGVALVDRDELARLAAQGEPASRLWLGAFLALGAVACWTWYPIRNARWLQRHPRIGSGTWATVQGLTTLPLALAGGGLLVAWSALAAADTPGAAAGAGFAPEAFLGPTPVRFVALMFGIGLGASWLGTLCWNRASQLLPTSIAGQLIVFETLAALLYAFLLRGEVPDRGTLAGIALLIVGVVLGIRALPARPGG
ncbi:MAG: DMT family transporter [Burkholderiaceae bacterium]